MKENNPSYWKERGSSAVFTSPMPSNELLKRLSPKSKILDFGCGYGRIEEFLISKKFEYIVGIDPSVVLIERAKKNLIFKKKKNILFRVGGMKGMKLFGVQKNKKFDAVIMCGVIEYIYDSKQRTEMIRCIADKIVRGGLFYLETFLRDLTHKKQYDTARNDGFEYGTLVLNNSELILYHDTIIGIQNLFKPYFKKVYGKRKSFLTWTGKKQLGYEILFEKR